VHYDETLRKVTEAQRRGTRGDLGQPQPQGHENFSASTHSEVVVAERQPASLRHQGHILAWNAEAN
jgi:hypothetical protein